MVNTPQKLGRNTIDLFADEHCERLRWLDAFEAQCTPRLLDELANYARRRLAFIARAGIPISPADAADVVSDAVTDTLDRRVTWDPTREALQLHLRDVIRWRVRDLRRQRRLVLVSSEPSAMSAAAPALTHEAIPDVEAIAAAGIAELRRVAGAHDDREVLRLIDAFVSGAVGRTALMHRSSLVGNNYDNARRRLHRYRTQVSPELRATVRALLASFVIP